MFALVMVAGVLAGAGDTQSTDPSCRFEAPFPAAPVFVDASAGVLEASCDAAMARADGSTRGQLALSADGSSSARDVAVLAGTCHRVEVALSLRLGPPLEEADLANLRALLRPSATQRAGHAHLRNALAVPAVRSEAGGAALTALSLGAIEARAVAGLTQFLVDRAKAEAELVLRNDLHRRLCAQGTGASVLPRSCRALQTSSEAFSLFAVGPYLRDAAYADLEALPVSALTLAACQLPKGATSVGSALVWSGRFAGEFAAAMRAGRDGFELLRGLAQLRPACAAERGPCQAFARMLVLGGVWTAALESQGPLPTAGGRRAAAMHAVGAMVAFDEAYVSVPAELKIDAEFRALDVTHFSAVARSLSTTAERLAAVRAKALALSRGAEYMASKRWADVAALGADLFSILVELMRAVPDPVLAAELVAVRAGLAHLPPFVRRLVASAGAPALAVGALELVDHVVTEAKLATPVPDAVSRALPLLGSIAAAGSADEVAQTLAAAAAPAGSHRTKFERPQLSLTAAVAASAGHEWLDDAGDSTDGSYLGLAAPIGLQATLPLGDAFAAGVYLSLLDLGTVAAFRTSRAGTLAKTEPNVGFAQVFSPGAFLTIQYGGLLLGGGVSAAPGLREITVEEDGTATPGTRAAGAMRASVFLGIDLTLLALP